MTSTGPETVLGNARIVLADRVIERGWIAFADGRIAEYGEGDAPSASEDAGGDLIMPGLIELHTDHLEAHYVPRPKVFWDPIAGLFPMMDSWRRQGSPPCWIRCGSGARTAPRKSMEGRACWPRRLQRRAMPACCDQIISCICAAKSRCRAW